MFKRNGQGESVCQYGRASDDRDCSLDVTVVNTWCQLDGDWKGALVLMGGDTGIGGDSGGRLVI